MTVRLAVTAVLIAALTGCGGGVDTASTSEEAPVGNNRPSADPDAEAKRVAENEAAAKAKAEEEAAADSTAKFGETYTWEDKVAVTVSQPAPFKPSEYSAGGADAAAHVAFTVTVVNGSAAPFDLSMFTASAQSGNTEAEEVYDSENGFNGSPTTKLLPGREAQFKIGFGVTTPDDIVLEVAPSFEHNSALFTS